jgi:hypothetical protein
MTLDWNRILSVLLAIIYIAAAYFFGSSELSWRVSISTILPLGCIWFSDAMGDYTGNMGSMPITQSSPGWIICIFGWLLLLMPVIIGACYVIFHSRA